MAKLPHAHAHLNILLNVHTLCFQVNLEYLGRVVFSKDGKDGKDRLLHPDSLVGTDSHTTMINGLGIIGWGMK